MEAIRNTARLLGLNPAAAARLKQQAEREQRMQEKAERSGRRTMHGGLQRAGTLTIYSGGNQYKFPVGTVQRQVQHLPYAPVSEETISMQLEVTDMQMMDGTVDASLFADAFRDGRVRLDLDGQALGEWRLVQCSTYKVASRDSTVVETDWVRPVEG